jgi:hypothetical protein
MQLSKYSLAGNFSKVGLGAKLGLGGSCHVEETILSIKFIENL